MPSILQFLEFTSMGTPEENRTVYNTPTPKGATSAQSFASIDQRKTKWDPIRAEAQKNIEKIKKYGSLGAAKSHENPNGLNDMVANNTPAPKPSKGLFGASTAHAADAPPPDKNYNLTDSWANKKPPAAPAPAPAATPAPITQQMKAVAPKPVVPKPVRPSNEELMAKAKQDAINASNADKKANPQDYDQKGSLITPPSPTAPQAAVSARDNVMRSVPKPPSVGQEEQFRVDNSKPSIVDKLKSNDNEDTMNNIIGKGKSMLGSFSNLAVDK